MKLVTLQIRYDDEAGGPKEFVKYLEDLLPIEEVRIVKDIKIR